MFSIRLCFAVLSLYPILIHTALALNPAQSIDQYVQDVWRSDQGLPQNTVQAIVATRRGYLWLGTQEGLVRFDGVKFTVFDSANTKEIRNNNVQSLLEDRDQVLWIGTEGGGLTSFKDGKFKNFSTANGLASDVIRAIHQDRNGTLWIGTYGGGLIRSEKGKFSSYSTQHGLSSDRISTIFEDPAGTLWIGTYGGGINQLRNGNFRSLTTRDGLSNDTVFGINQDEEGNIWIATRKGLNRYKDGKFTLYGSKDGVSSDDTITSLYKDRDGNLWIGTGAAGLNRLYRGKFSYLTSALGLSNDRVRVIYEDPERNLWVGTEGGGLNRFKDGRFTTYTTKEGLSSDMIYSIYEDRDENVWIGTRGGGLDRLKDDKVQVYTEKDGLPVGVILSTYQDHDGVLWIGTEGAGLVSFKNGKFQTYNHSDGLSHDMVYSVFPDSQNRLWIGTGGGGLNEFHDGKFKVYTTKEGLSGDVVFSICEDQKGNLWIGTYNGGISRYKNGKFINYTVKDGLSNNTVFTLYPDPDGSLWIGTYGGGLNLLKDGKFTVFRAEDGLFNDTIYQILDDGLGSLWFSCNKGIFRVKKQELMDFASGKLSHITSFSYGKSDGMKSNECNGAVQPAGWKDRKGRLWFPTIQGAVMIDPKNLKTNPYIPPVHVEKFDIDDLPYLNLLSQRQQTVKIPPGDGKLEFHYTGLSFVAPEKVQFRYKLEGFDRDWVTAGTRRIAYYTNIPPGNYQFKVTASNNDGLWNPTPTVLRFYLTPYFYQTFWFYGLCTIAVGLLVWTFYRVRMKHLNARFMAVLGERSRIARELHDTLAAGLAGIVMQLEAAEDVLLDSPEESRDHLSRARDVAKASLAEARQSVWATRPQSLESGDLAMALSNTARQQTSASKTKLQFSVSGTPRPLPQQLESNFLRICQEAVTNALTHAHPTDIEIHLQYAPHHVTLQVADDGQGFDAANPVQDGAAHAGLLGMRERVQQIRGKLIVDSKPGAGTRIIVSAPSE